MNQSKNNLNGDPSQLTIKQKVELFEKTGEKNEFYKPLTFYNNFAISNLAHKREISSSENNMSSINMTTTTSNNNTSTPLSSGINTYRRRTAKSQSNSLSKSSSQPYMNSSSSYPIKVSDTISRIINDNKSTTSYFHSPVSRVENSSVNMKEFHDAIKDLDTFLARELNEIEIQKRIGSGNTERMLKESSIERDKKYGEQILQTLQTLKEEINEIKVNQKEFEEKIRKQEQIKYRMPVGRSNDVQRPIANNNDDVIYKQNSNLKACTTNESDLPKKNIKHTSTNLSQKNSSVDKISQSTEKSTKTVFEAPIIAASSYSREERIRKLESEIYKAETLMMKINRVLENLKNVDDRNLVDIINIERHYLVASTRFQSALSEIRKLNDNEELPHLPPYNRKGKLLIRDIMLEIKPSYFQRPIPIKNEFLLVLMKYEDKVYATKAMRIIDDVRIIKFSEKFSIPEIYMDFDIRLEIYGTTFWRKNSSVRETMLKKYGFVTFSMADTGNKLKRFQMIEVLTSENVPIRSKVMMKITQKITTDVKYRGNLFVKMRDVWHEASCHLSGHLLEISFKKIYNSGISRSQETMLLDLYNVDSDAVIPVDVKRVSDKPYTFLLKFNHYVDVANFYLMVAAETSEAFSEWITALNKVLVLIK